MNIQVERIKGLSLEAFLPKQHEHFCVVCGKYRFCYCKRWGELNQVCDKCNHDNGSKK